MFMPEFLDEFAASLAPKKDAVKDKVLKGTPNPLANRFREKFPSFWVEISDPAKLGASLAELSVMAVDSSVLLESAFNWRRFLCCPFFSGLQGNRA